MGTTTGTCCYHGEDAQDIPGLRHLKGVLFIDGQKKVHCFRTNAKQKDAVVVTRKKVVIPNFVQVPTSESEAQANDLWDSVSKGDLVPADQGRISGTVSSWGEKNGYGFIHSDDDGRELYVHRADVAADEYNRRFLIISERVTFRKKNGHSAEHSDQIAAFVRPTRVNRHRDAPIAFREEFVVVEYDPIKKVGRLQQLSDFTARRVFFFYRDVLTEGSIFPGVRFWAGLKRHSGSSFRAHSIEVIKED
jgi:cold shock CspA family protein